MTPVPVSVSRILHKNSPLTIKTTYLSLSLLYLWYVLYFVFWIFVFSIFNFLICILIIASHSVHTSLCSALQTSLLYFGANLVIRAQPCDYILLHIVHMSVHCESILRCCKSSIHFTLYTKCTWISNSKQHSRKGVYAFCTFTLNVNINFWRKKHPKKVSCYVLQLTLVFGKCATTCNRLDRDLRGKTFCTKYVVSSSRIPSAEKRHLQIIWN